MTRRRELLFVRVGGATLALPYLDPRERLTVISRAIQEQAERYIMRRLFSQAPAAVPDDIQ